MISEKSTYAISNKKRSSSDRKNELEQNMVYKNIVQNLKLKEYFDSNQKSLNNGTQILFSRLEISLYRM